jgi:hypothetical protein
VHLLLLLVLLMQLILFYLRLLLQVLLLLLLLLYMLLYELLLLQLHLVFKNWLQVLKVRLLHLQLVMHVKRLLPLHMSCVRLLRCLRARSTESFSRWNALKRLRCMLLETTSIWMRGGRGRLRHEEVIVRDCRSPQIASMLQGFYFAEVRELQWVSRAEGEFRAVFFI